MEPYNFEGISELDRQKGKKLEYKQLGILRLDVDHLGAIFSFGLQKDNKTSFARIATLSRELHLFFSGLSNSLAQKHQIYTVYSGGDDAFFIGSWINILHFANDFRDHFKKYVCDNKNLTFSAGIYMCHHRHPIAKFAEEAAEMEKLSKKNNNGEKNAITVFEHTLKWDRFNEMLKFSENLLNHISINDNEKNNEKLARSFVHRVLRMIKSSMYSKGENEGQIHVDKLHQNAVQLRYLLARRNFTHEEIEKKQKAIVKDVLHLLLNNFNKKEVVKDFLIPLNYAILKTRKVENK